MTTFTGFAALWRLELNGYFFKELTCALGLVIQHIEGISKRITSLSRLLMVIEASASYTSFRGSILVPFRAKFPSRIEMLNFTLTFEQQQARHWDSAVFFLLSLEEYRYVNSFP